MLFYHAYAKRPEVFAPQALKGVFCCCVSAHVSKESSHARLVFLVLELLDDHHHFFSVKAKNECLLTKFLEQHILLSSSGL